MDIEDERKSLSRGHCFQKLFLIYWAHKKISDLLDFTIIKDLNKNQIKLSSNSNHSAVIDYFHFDLKYEIATLQL